MLRRKRCKKRISRLMNKYTILYIYSLKYKLGKGIVETKKK